MTTPDHLTLTEIIDWLDGLGVPFFFADTSDSFRVLVCRHENTRWQADAARYFLVFNTVDSLVRWAWSMGCRAQRIGEPSSSSAPSTPDSSSRARPASVSPMPPATAPPPMPV